MCTDRPVRLSSRHAHALLLSGRVVCVGGGGGGGGGGGEGGGIASHENRSCEMS